MIVIGSCCSVYSPYPSYSFLGWIFWLFLLFFWSSGCLMESASNLKHWALMLSTSQLKKKKILKFDLFSFIAMDNPVIPHSP